MDKNIKKLPDVQNGADKRGVAIQWVGISGYKIPFQVKTKAGENISTVATVDIMTDLDAKSKGVNMSRFSSVIEKGLDKKLVSSDLIVDMLEACRDILGNRNSYIVIKFDYFIKKKSPTTDNHSHFVIPCNLCGILEDGKIKIYLEAAVDYTSLCPCSKKISTASAHNQRSTAHVRVRFKHRKLNHLLIEDIVDLVEKAASCPIWNLLKREDEKFVTEKAYSKPMFVEDMIREVALSLDKKKQQVAGYKIKIEHFESIHQHIAVSKISKNIR